jgi:hypothetical protein
MRIAAGLLVFVLLTACGDESGLQPLPIDQVRAYFPPGAVVNAIEVTAANRLPLRSAELIAPDGDATPASYLHVNAEPSVTYNQRSAYGADASNALLVGSLAPVSPLTTDLGGAPQARAELLAMVSIASIPLPDEIAYRRDWRSYRIFLSFGDQQNEVERRVLPAPEPPPGG